MPCNCPDDKSAPPVPRSGCAYLVHSGGPASNLYSLVEHAIPDVEMAHGRPKVHPDGSLEFPGPPPAIPGYRLEGSRLYPAWPPCTCACCGSKSWAGCLTSQASAATLRPNNSALKLP